MDNKENIGYIIVFLALIIILLSYPAIAWTTSVLSSSETAVVNYSSIFGVVNEDKGQIYNISINHTSGTNNVTEINISLWGNFIFVSGSNQTANVTEGSDEQFAIYFSNTSDTLSWNATNSTSYIFPFNKSLNSTFFWFNATVATPGKYNITVRVRYNNTVVINETNITVLINDTTLPDEINVTLTGRLGSLTYSNVSGSLTINVSVADNGNFSAGGREITGVNISFFNGTEYNTSYIALNQSAFSYRGYYWNVTVDTSIITQGVYNITIITNDSNNNFNITNISNIRIDNVIPYEVNISNSSHVSRGNYSGIIIFNASVLDAIAGVNTVVFNITNASAEQNITHMYYTAARSGDYFNSTVNTSLFADGVYNLTIYANDSAGNLNATISWYNITFDNTKPNNVSNANASQIDNSNYTGIFIFNVSAVDATALVATVIFNVTYVNGTQNASYTAQRSGDYFNITINTSQFPEGRFNISVIVNDSANNLNNTLYIGNLTFDNIVPNNLSNANTSILSGGNYSGSFVFNVSALDATVGMQTVIFNVTYVNGTQAQNGSATTTRSGDYFTATINTSLFLEGRYNISIIANDSLNNLNTTLLILNLTFDNTVPNNVSNANASHVATGNYSGTFVFNVSALDTIAGVNTVIVNITNSTSSQNASYTAARSGDYFNVTIVTTQFPDGRYNISVLANDSAGNLNNTFYLGNITFDNTKPNNVSNANTSIISTGNYSGTFVFNVSALDATAGMGNVIVNLTNSSGGQNASYTAARSGDYFNATINTSNFPDGRYNISVLANDSAGNLNNTFYLGNITFDNTRPNEVNFTNSSFISFANFSGVIFINVSALDATAGINTVYVNITNATAVVQNATYTASKVGNIFNVTVNTSHFVDGRYNITVWVNDSSNNLNNTRLIYNVTFDNSAPTVSAGCSDATTSDAFPCSCTREDNVSGIQSTSESSDSPDNLARPSTTGSFIYTCTVTNHAGISTTRTAGYRITQGGSSVGGGGGGGGTSSTSDYKRTITVSEKLNKEGISVNKQLAEKERIKIEVVESSSVSGGGGGGTSTHYVGIKDIKNNSVVIEITSNPIIVELFVGEEKKVDLNNDDIYDIKVKLNSIINNNKADLKVEYIREALPQEVTPPVEESIEEEEPVVEQEEEEISVKKSYGWLWTLLAVIIIIIIIIVLIMTRAPKKRFY